MEDSGIDSDQKSASNSSFETQVPNTSKTVADTEANDAKPTKKALELQKKIEKQREKNRRKQIVDEQPKRSFLLPRSRLNIPSKHDTTLQSHDQQPLVAIMSDDNEEDEFAVPKLSKEAQKEIAEQLLKDGYQIDVDLDDDDLDLIPPRPLNQRNTIRVSNGLDPDQDGHSVGPDLGPNCLQKLSADEKKLPLAREELMTLWG